MSVRYPQEEEDALSFEWNANPEDLRNISFILDEQSPEHALQLRIGGTTATLAADEAMILLDWLSEREPTLFELTQQQTIAAPNQETEGESHPSD